MKLELLDHLRCTCNGNLKVSNQTDLKDDRLYEGELKCGKCGNLISVKGGIPLFIKSEFDTKTQKNFGYSWNIFSDIYNREKIDFLNWLFPVKGDFFKGKLVLDAGCGNGLHARMASEFGAETVIGIDLSSAVAAAFSNTEAKKNIHIIQANIYDPPFEKCYFDYIYAIGVIQHLPEREKAIETLASRLKKGGALSIWVYGHEGTWFVRRIVEPLRRVISKFHPQIILGLSLPPAIGFFCISRALKTIDKWNKNFPRFFPMGSYFSYMGHFPFKYQFNTVFDQLVAPRTHYFKKEELEQIFERFSFEEVIITSRNKMS